MSELDNTPADAPVAPEAGNPEPENFDALPKWARDKLDKTAREAKNLRERLKAQEEAERKAREEADRAKPLEDRLTAAEKRAKELEEAAAQAEAKRVAAERRAALTGRVADPTAALKLLEDAHLDADGNVNVEALLAAYPFLATQATKAPPSLPGAPSGVGAGKPITLDSLRGRSPEEINAHWEELRAQQKRR